MAWRCSGATNKELIANLKSGGIFHSDRVMKAMAAVDRGNYVRDKSDAYKDSPQPIGHGATISAPHMHAYASEHLLPYLRPGARVLDIGSGSGYLAAVLHHLVSPGGKVVGIEHIPELAEWSIGNLKRDGLGEALDKGEIVIVAGDGREGWKDGGPYDAIHVGAAAPTVPPALLEQLASPGRMFIPVGSWDQYIEHIDKDDKGHVTKQKVMGVRYVPLTDRDKQVESSRMR
ncbi:Pcmt1-prov protein [Coprinopsis cinerea okayama7|uniref:Protein-L-isoaspartate O-methyltransferase n=1 Tax=Coprinopsis cinerea (strain Okayama-7 / 130 / ATCC MYA-4618 / FGSC 9003) TaxID=240176 RepID=D6RPM5_COPC7|nr:Pcmt1-prov protein [Coprinopsis cinerea okayama7\|eukprot:XP_002910494.1 Pcmt1-prov protein [Coprinopsis cinerea okayama7\